MLKTKRDSANIKVTMFRRVCDRRRKTWLACTVLLFTIILIIQHQIMVKEHYPKLSPLREDVLYQIMVREDKSNSLKHKVTTLATEHTTVQFKTKIHNNQESTTLSKTNNFVHDGYYRCEDEISLFSLLSSKNYTVVPEKKYLLLNPMLINGKKHSIPFLKHFQNPCFLQRLSSENPYKGVQHDSRLPASQERCAKEVFASRVDNSENVRVRCFPYFIVAGVQKCGTTDLYNTLPLHNQITKFTIKENHWWNRGRFRAHKPRKNSRPITLEGYLDLFDTQAESILRDYYTLPGKNTTKVHTMVTGDVSPAILWDQGYWRLMPENAGLEEPAVLVPHLIKHLLPDTKFIIIVRNPTDRLFSDWLFFSDPEHKNSMQFHTDIEIAVDWFNNCVYSKPLRACFYDSLNRDPYMADAMREDYPWWHPVFRLRMGLYYIFIKDLLDVFPRNQVMVLRLEDYSKDRFLWLSNIFNFLELEPDHELAAKLHKTKIYNRNKKLNSPEISPKTQLLLDEFYHEYNVKLAELLQNKDFEWQR